MQYLIFLIATTIVLMTAGSVFSQGYPIYVHRSTKTDRFEFGPGGTLTITGAPSGSVRIVGGDKNEVEITAEIQVERGDDGDMAKLASAIGFVADESRLRSTISTIGPHNKFGLKKLPKNFPKELLTLPWRVNYTITVPRYCDLEIDGGKGELSVTGVEGSMRINFVEAEGRIDVLRGETMVTLASGRLEITFGPRGWRAAAANIQLGRGDLLVKLPVNASADIDAAVLRTGRIENTIGELKPRDRKIAFSDKSVMARMGVGGPSLKFTVGDGILKLDPLAR